MHSESSTNARKRGNKLFNLRPQIFLSHCHRRHIIARAKNEPSLCWSVITWFCSFCCLFIRFVNNPSLTCQPSAGGKSLKSSIGDIKKFIHILKPKKNAAHTSSLAPRWANFLLSLSRCRVFGIMYHYGALCVWRCCGGAFFWRFISDARRNINVNNCWLSAPRLPFLSVFGVK